MPLRLRNTTILHLDSGSKLHSQFLLYTMAVSDGHVSITMTADFALEDLPGYYTVLGGGNSEFNSTFMRLIQKQFVPKRYERNKTPN